MWKPLLLVVAVSSFGTAVMAETTAFDAEIAQLRLERVDRLTQPLGWLSLVGLDWFDPGQHRVGSAADNDIVLTVGPAYLGLLRLDGETVVLEPAEAADFLVDGAKTTGSITLIPDSRGTATQVNFEAGNSGFNLIERSGRYALRVRDANAATRTKFAGIDYYPANPSWRIEARFEPHPEGTTIPIANVVNQIEETPNPGAVVFEREGETWRLEALAEDDGSLFFVFSDRTSGRDTYGGGRQLDAAAAKDGKVIMDFNLAYNPPCAFNDYSTCPLPPPENRLKLVVSAGEKKYKRPD